MGKKRSRGQGKPEPPSITRVLFASPEPQERCFLFRLPPETRWMIYEYVFTEVDVGSYAKNITDEEFVENSLETSKKLRPKLPCWLRPGCTTRTKIWMEFLQTCKKVYNEASPIPINLKEHKCYMAHGPGQEPREYFKKFEPWPLSQIRSLHIYMQPSTLGDGTISLRNQLKMVAPTLECLTITIRNCTSGSNPSVLSDPLQVNPYRGETAGQSNVREDMESMDNGQNLMMFRSGWAGTFASLKSLRTLTMKFEHHQGYELELERLAQWAQKWRFPLKEDYVLISDSTERRSWRGLLSHAPFTCWICSSPVGSQTKLSIACEACKWRRRGRCSQMITWSVKWAKRKESLFENMSVKPRQIRRPAVRRQAMHREKVRPPPPRDWSPIDPSHPLW